MSRAAPRIPRNVQVGKRAPSEKVGWHEARFIEDRRKERVDCSVCGTPMWLPRSKASRYKSCSPACQASYRARAKAARSRECETCGTVFCPRPQQLRAGRGRYCSQKCNTAGLAALTSQEVAIIRRAIKAELVAAGYLRFPREEQNKAWKGGTLAYRERDIKSGNSAKRLRRYRAANPELVREQRRRRNAKMLGPLPPGTLRRVGDAQRWRCAICRKRLTSGYHLDHIMPLARGGEHLPRNIQLLCSGCNLKKNAHDPLDFMRSLGRLL